MLKIQKLPVQRKATSGISLMPISFTLSTVPRTALNRVIEPELFPNTTIGSEMGLPLASHTVNLTGMVLPALRLYTLEPSALIGGKMTPPGFGPVQVP